MIDVTFSGLISYIIVTMADNNCPTYPVPSEFTDGTELWRINARNGALHWDYTLTALGFSGTESADGITGDWYNPSSVS